MTDFELGLESGDILGTEAGDSLAAELTLIEAGTLWDDLVATWDDLVATWDSITPVTLPPTAGYPADADTSPSPFTYYVCNLFTGEILEEMPFSKFGYSRTKNKPGGWDANIGQQQVKATDTLLSPWARSVYAARDNTLLYGGILQTRNTESDEEMKIGGEGFFSYYQQGRRSLRSKVGMLRAGGKNDFEIIYTQVDQFEIVMDFLRHAASYSGGANVSYDIVRLHGPGVGGLSGVLRDRTYYTYELKEIGEAIEQMSEVIDGFDFSESYYWENNAIKRAFDLWFPWKGNLEPITMEVGNNVILLNRDEDGTAFATRAIALGSGEADAQLQAESVKAGIEYPTGPYPMLEHIETYSDVSIQATLQSHSQFDVNQASILKETLELEVTDRWEVELGAFDWGDAVIAYASDGALQVSDIYRIESFGVDIQGAGISIKPTLVLYNASLGI